LFDLAFLGVLCGSARGCSDPHGPKPLLHLPAGTRKAINAEEPVVGRRRRFPVVSSRFPVRKGRGLWGEGRGIASGLPSSLVCPRCSLSDLRALRGSRSRAGQALRSAVPSRLSSGIGVHPRFPSAIWSSLALSASRSASLRAGLGARQVLGCPFLSDPPRPRRLRSSSRPRLCNSPKGKTPRAREILYPFRRKELRGSWRSRAPRIPARFVQRGA
jgi:hypothetical protein